jgi:hypothetical protein
LAKTSTEEVVGSVITSMTCEISGIVGQSPIGSIIICTGQTSCRSVVTWHAQIICVEISTDAITTPIDQLVEKITCAICAQIMCRIVALIT